VRVLLVEDDDALAAALCAGLQAQGDRVVWAQDGRAALSALDIASHGADAGPVDVVLLDLGLPALGGLEVLARVRRDGNGVPVIVLSGHTDVVDRVEALDRGADDFLVKPFELTELLARMRSLIRRAHGEVGEQLNAGGVSVDLASHQVTWDGAAVELSPLEFALLRELLGHRGQVLSRQRLEGCLYGWSTEVASNTVEVHVHHLRRKLPPGFIQTVRGAGYRVQRSP
jgi:two-component system response regulator QseB